MLPPHELKNKSFSRAMRGYNPVEVDEYIEFLIEKYTELYRENDELERKLKSAVTKLEEFKNDEDSIRSALIDAKRAATHIRTEAEERAEAIIRSAKSSCNTILSDFNDKIEEGRNLLISLKLDTVELKHELFDRYSEHIRYIDKLTDGIDTSDIPDADSLRREAVNSLKTKIADIYASPAKPSGENPSESDFSDVSANFAENINTEQHHTDTVESAVDLSKHSKNETAEYTETAEEEKPADITDDTIEFTPTADDMSSIRSELGSGADETDDTMITFDKILGKPTSETSSDDEPSLIVNREPLMTKPSKSGLKGSISDLNKRYRESEDIINTPDSDLEDDANYLDFVKTVTGKESSPVIGKESDFDLLFNESKNKKKK